MRRMYIVLCLVLRCALFGGAIRLGDEEQQLQLPNKDAGSVPTAAGGQQNTTAAHLASLLQTAASLQLPDNRLSYGGTMLVIAALTGLPYLVAGLLLPMVSAGAAQDVSAETKRELRGQSTYWLARSVLYRGMGFIYLIAFLVSLQQNKGLFGDYGVSPVKHKLAAPDARPVPAFWLLGFGDWQLDVVACTGIVVSTFMLFAPACSFVLPGLCWLLYLSILNLDSFFVMNYGWEWQILETGFLVTFLYPLYCKRFAAECPPSFLVILLCRWLCFRVMLGSGLSKLGSNGSVCWRDLTCTTTHYLTQPLPNALAWFMSKVPLPVHKLEVVIVLLAELPLTFLLLLPFRNIRLFAAFVQFFLQACIIFTGNYAFINWITLLPFVAFFDDAFLGYWLFPARSYREALEADRGWAVTAPSAVPAALPLLGSWGDATWRFSPFGPADVRNMDQRIPPGQAREERQQRPPASPQVYSGFSILQRVAMMVVCPAITLLIAHKSVAPMQELMGRSPWLEYYDNYFFVNAYGVFGVINQKRLGISFEYTHDGKEWKTMDLHAYPGSEDRMPAFVTPYHYRVDWQTWIEVTAYYERRDGTLEPWDGPPNWLHRLLGKVMAGDTQAAAFFAAPFEELFSNGRAPQQIRATPYLYEYSDASSLLHGQWWKRSNVTDAQPDVYHMPWTGAVSLRPPTFDWALLFQTLSFTAALGALMGMQERDGGADLMYAALGLWSVVICATVVLMDATTWKACWSSGFVIALGAWLRRRRCSAPTALSVKFLSDGAASSLQRNCTFRMEGRMGQALALFVMLVDLFAFAATSKGFITMAALGLAVAVILLLWMLSRQLLNMPGFAPAAAASESMPADGLLCAAAAFTTAALISSGQACFFHAPLPNNFPQ
eukprot:TRINITY_DN32644_c0_g1_i2.p1 TRINITY_DN32644_c0_g1~~TRINITY_DN32644_c0_g1_i2.p1  ORF type:complete len:889 (+),score=173.88 TRINITY_DN32644_c0_g1_i2:68-2734(+)